MALPDITRKMRFEEHIALTAKNLNTDLTVNEIVAGVDRLTVAPDQFNEVEISGVRKIDAISILIKASTQSH